MPTKLVLEIAERLKAARKAAGYKSAKEFAESNHIPLSTYSQHETGKRSINAELIISYCKKLQVNPEWLLTGENKQKTNEHLLTNIELLKKALFSVEDLINNEEVTKLSFQDIVSYCFEVYFMVSSLTIDSTEKEKIIDLTISSLKRGATTGIKLQNLTHNN